MAKTRHRQRRRNRYQDYVEGEGYASNILPFVGVAPKTLKRRYSEKSKMETMRLVEEAMDPRRRQRIWEMRERMYVSQSVPVPQDMIPELQEGGWLEAAALAKHGEECKVDVDDEAFEDQGMRWQLINFRGSPDAVSAGKLTLMAGLAPPRADLI